MTRGNVSGPGSKLPTSPVSSPASLHDQAGSAPGHAATDIADAGEAAQLRGDSRSRALRELPKQKIQIRKIIDSEFGHESLLLLAALVMVGYFSYRSPFFLTIGNVRNLLETATPLGLLCLPVTFLMVGGSIDISGAGMAGLSGMSFVLLTHGGTGSITAGVTLTLLIGLVGGIANGVLVVLLRINPIICTLGTLTIFEGVANIVSNGQTVPLSGFTALGGGDLPGGIPIQLALMVGLAVVSALVLRSTSVGRHIRATGSNPEAARLEGVQSRRLLFMGFLLSGTVASVVGLILVSQLGAASPTTGASLDLFVVAAVILGGASLRGGKGSIEGTILGVLILGALQNGLVIINVSSFWGEVVEGAVLIVAVAADRLRPE